MATTRKRSRKKGAAKRPFTGTPRQQELKKLILGIQRRRKPRPSR